MNRVTQKHLQAVCDRINRALGKPESPWKRTDDGRTVANIGNYHISGAYGGVSLHRMETDGGGISDVFRCGHVPKRELANRMQAFLDGIEAARRVD